MIVSHYGLACRSEQKADRFYREFLGLKKLERKTVPAALSGALFGIACDLTVLNYTGNGVHFEIFIHEGERPTGRPPAHICLAVGDIEAFLERCRAMDVPVIRAPRGEQWITFVQDYDGNQFEIKESAA